MENLKEQPIRSQICIAENGTLKKALLLQSKNYKADKAKKFESDPSFLLKSEDLKEEVKFREN